MSLFSITLVVAGLALVIGVLAIVRGRPFVGFLAILIAIAVAGFGYWDTASAADHRHGGTTTTSDQSSSLETVAPEGRISRASTEA